MICLTTPFYRGHLEGYFPGHLRVLYCVRVDYRTPRDCSSPRLVAWQVSPALWSPALDAEDLRDRSRLLGLSFFPLHHPGLRGAWTAPHQ